MKLTTNLCKMIDTIIILNTSALIITATLPKSKYLYAVGGRLATFSAIYP